jgi:transposase
MGYREVGIMEYREVVRRWLGGEGVRAIARATGLDRKTVRPYIAAAEALGLKRGDALPEESHLGEIAARARGPRETPPPGETELALLGRREQIGTWLGRDGLLLTKVHELLQREGLDVPYSSLHRFARKWCDFGSSALVTVRRPEGKPGEMAEVDFGRLGLIREPDAPRPRVVHGFVMVLGYSRLSCIVPTFRQDIESVIRCFEEALTFFGGCPRRVIFDCLKACVEVADSYTPRLSRAFQEYAEFRGFLPDSARPYHPKDKPQVERHIRYVRERFFKGETFLDLEDIRRRALVWCKEIAGRRIHGTTRRVPMEVFETEERGALVTLRAERFEIPHWGRCKVHPDHCVRIDRAEYTVPTRYVGKDVDVRSARPLVRIYHGTELIKTHPWKAPGGRSIDYEDYPKDRAAYAMRFPDYYRRRARVLGPSAGDFTDQLLAGEFPWSRLRQAQKLLRLGERYGAQRVDAACRRALSFELVDVHRVGRILEQALEKQEIPVAAAAAAAVPMVLRFLRPPSHFRHDPPEGGNDGDPS